MNTGEIVYFGYGSLVNRDTRPAHERAFPARLHRWRRIWEHGTGPRVARGPVCSLSIEPLVEVERGASGACEESGIDGIDGVVVRLPVDALPALDRRESGYDRLALPIAAFDLPDDFPVGDVVHVYRSRCENRIRATPDRPILQSYIDCVMAGYLRVFGDAGLDAFVRSTHGWEGAIENDRAAPRYPRAVPIEAALCRRFDAQLAARRGGEAPVPGTRRPGR